MTSDKANTYVGNKTNIVVNVENLNKILIIHKTIFLIKEIKKITSRKITEKKCSISSIIGK